MKKTSSCLLFFFLLSQPGAFAVQLSAPGVIESYEKLLSIDERQGQKAVEALAKNTLQSPLPNDAKINSYFLKSIILNSQPRYLLLADKGECSFYSLLENGLLKWDSSYGNNILVDVKTDKGILSTYTLPIQTFLTQTYKNKCFSNREQQELFTDRNLQKTISAMNFIIPRSETECRSVFASWKNNDSLPQLCRLYEIEENATKAEKQIKTLDSKEYDKRQSLEQTIARKKSILTSVPFFQRSYISNLCKNLDNENEYCSNYVGQDTWNRVMTGELPQYFMTSICKDVLRKKTFTKEDLVSCASKMKEAPQLCHTLGGKNSFSLFPHPNCKEVALALNVSHLKTEYQDCPSRGDTEGLTNINRLLFHFAPKDYVLSKSECQSDPYFNYSKMALEFHDSTDTWPLKVCFTEPVTKTESCEAFIPGNSATNKLSEGAVVTKILTKLRGARDKALCKTVDKKDYNPILLEYKVGCYIVKDLNACSGNVCERKVYVDQDEIKGLTFKGIFLYEYFAASYATDKFSASNILAETLKLQEKPIKNLTELSFFLSQYKEALVHGVGCAEDLLPSFFTREALNACTPVAFIIDGVLKQNNTNYLSLRTSIDDIRLPRLVSWGFVYSAVTNYRELHPLQKWTLNGIK